MTFKLSYRMFHVFVQTMCVVVAIALACLCVHKYFLDDDLAEINFQTFNDKEHAIYPSITLCFMGPDIFLKNELKRFDFQCISKPGISRHSTKKKCDELVKQYR